MTEQLSSFVGVVVVVIAAVVVGLVALLLSIVSRIAPRLSRVHGISTKRIECGNDFGEIFSLDDVVDDRCDGLSICDNETGAFPFEII